MKLSFQTMSILKISLVSAMILMMGNFTNTFSAETWSVINGTGIESNSLQTLNLSQVFHAMGLYKGDIYFAGYITNAGNTPVNGIAKWDGKQWSAVGTPLNIGANSFKGMFELAIDSTGNMYVWSEALGVYNASGNPLIVCAKWNGSNWSTIISPFYRGTSGMVLFCDKQGNLYDGRRNYLKKYQNGVWSDIGLGLRGEVNSICQDNNGILYVGGSIDSIGEKSVTNNVVKWNGTVWDTVGTLITDKKHYIEALCMGNDNHLFASVCSTSSFNSTIYNSSINEWDGVTWKKIYSSIYYMGNISFDASKNMSVKRGDGYIVRQKSNIWSQVGLKFGAMSHIAIRDSLIYACGGFSKIGGIPTGSGDWQYTIAANGFAVWDGVQWDSLDTRPISGDVCSICRNKTDIFVGGMFRSRFGIFTDHIAKWDGLTWGALGTGVKGNITSIATGNNGIVFAAGGFSIAGGVTVNCIAQWNGVSWAALDSGLSLWQSAIAPVLAMDTNGLLYAGGSFSKAGGKVVNKIAMWDGKQWNSLGSGIQVSTSSKVKALAIDKKNALYVGGSFDSVSGISAKNVASWDGKTWHALGGGLNDTVRALALDSAGNVYAGGKGIIKCGTTNCNVAKWDGVSWSGLCPCQNGNAMVNSLACDGFGNLFAGCKYDTTSRSALLKWNGVNWESINSNGDVYAVLANDSSLFAGGRFSRIGNVYSPNIGMAKLNGDAVPLHQDFAIDSKGKKISVKINYSSIFISGLNGGESVEVYSLSGKCLFANEYRKPLNISSFKSGPLMIRVKRTGQILYSKLLLWIK